MNATIIRTRRRTICIQIHPEKGVIVRAPKRVSDHRIEKFLNEKRAWINKTRAKLNATKRKIPTYNFEPNELFPYLGEPTPLPVHTRPKVMEWYKTSALKFLTERTYLQAKLLSQKTRNRITPKQVKIRNYRSRWGTCHRDNSITYNWKIIMAPLPIIDYLVIHELTHILHRNHGPAFKKTLALLDPDYKQNQKWLRENSPTLTV